MLNPIFSLCVYIVEVLIAHLFFSEIFENRCSAMKGFMFGAVLAIIGSSINLIFKNVHIGFSQQQPKQQQRVPALQRAGRLSVCG